MASFIALNLISGKLTWSQVESSKIYAKYADAALVVLDNKGYMIDADGNCVKKPVEATEG